MRLLFCCEFYHPERGGVQEVMRQIAERMVLAGHEVTVATTDVPTRDFEVLNGVRIRGFKAGGNLAYGLKGEIERYRDFVVSSGADAILIKAAQQWTFDALWPVLDRLPGRKVFVPCGFSLLRHPDFAEYYRQMPDVLRKFDHLVFYAERYRDIDFARAYGFDNFFLIPNGASEVEFDDSFDGGVRARLGLSDQDFVFLTVGSPILGKGHGEIAEAFARLETGGRSAALILNGSWPPRSSSSLVGLRTMWGAGRKALSRIYKVAARREILGQPFHSLRELEQWIARANAQPGKRILQLDLSRSELVNLFKAADLFVFASNLEYSPLVLFEAIAAGTPFLSVPVGNAEEIARWTGGGCICPAAEDRSGYTRVDPQVLADEMQRLMNDPVALGRFSETGRTRWRERFTWNDIARHYEGVLAGRAIQNDNPRARSGGGVL